MISRAQTLALLTAAAVAPTAVRAQTATTKIRLGTSVSDSYGTAFYSIDGGFLGKAGISADVTILPNGERLVQAMAGNALDVAIADPIQVAHAINAGVPLVFIAGGGLYTSTAPATALIVAKNSPLRQPKDLEGTTVGVVGLASVSALAVREWMRQSSIDLDKVKLVEVGFPEMAAAVVRGTVSAAFLGEPFLSGHRDEIRIFAKAYDAIGKQFYICAWFTTRDWIDKNPDVAKRLVGAAYDTARWSNAHHAETATILAKYLKIEVDKVQAMTRCVYATSLDARLMQPMLDIAYKYKALEKPVDANTIFARV
jgi:NitT/TauT family transport system substrate-binding protein